MQWVALELVEQKVVEFKAEAIECIIQESSYLNGGKVDPSIRVCLLVKDESLLGTAKTFGCDKGIHCIEMVQRVINMESIEQHIALTYPRTCIMKECMSIKHVSYFIDNCNSINN